MGRAPNIHIIMALQRPETSVLDGAIRDNYPVRIGLGNLKKTSTNGIWSNDDSVCMGGGQGYISINDVIESYESPWVGYPGIQSRKEHDKE